MDYRKLGRSGLKVSPLCLGTMMFGGPTDERRIRRASSPARGRPGSTSSTPRTPTTKAAPRRSSAARSGPSATTGCWRPRCATPMGPGPNQSGLSRRWMFQACDASLARLGTDWIDIMYLHKEDHDTPLEETVDRDGRSDPRGQDALLRRLQLPQLAARRDLQPLRPARHRPAGGRASPTTTR